MEKDGEEMENESPCKTCTRVDVPELCDCKSCVAWRKWFLKRWEEVRNGIRKAAD